VRYAAVLAQISERDRYQPCGHRWAKVLAKPTKRKDFKFELHEIVSNLSETPRAELLALHDAIDTLDCRQVVFPDQDESLGLYAFIEFRKL
jgi:hypothetical protein